MPLTHSFKEVCPSGAKVEGTLQGRAVIYLRVVQTRWPLVLSGRRCRALVRSAPIDVHGKLHLRPPIEAAIAFLAHLTFISLFY